MKRLIVLIILICGMCGLGWSEDKKLNVLTTTSDLKFLSEEIGGQYVSVKSVCTGSQDPHFAEAKPSLIINARKANLFVKIGLELEIGYEAPLLEGARNTKIKPGSDGYLDVSENMLILEAPAGRVDRSMGDIHPFGNPHYWLDPYNGRIMAGNITERLKKLMPEYKEVFDKNYGVFVKKLDEAMFGVEAVAQIDGDKLWEQELAGKLDEFIIQTNAKRATPDTPRLELGGWVKKAMPLRGMKIVMFHRSWTYFLHRFKMISIGEVEPKPGIPPGPAHLKNLIDKIKTEQARVILMESFYDRKSSDFVAGQTGVKVIVSPLSVDGESGIKDYISLIDNLVNKLLEVTTAK